MAFCGHLTDFLSFYQSHVARAAIIVRYIVELRDIFFRGLITSIFPFQTSCMERATSMFSLQITIVQTKITLRISLKSTICQIIEIVVFQFKWKSNKLPNGYESIENFSDATNERIQHIRERDLNRMDGGHSFDRHMRCFWDLFNEFQSLKHNCARVEREEDPLESVITLALSIFLLVKPN